LPKRKITITTGTRAEYGILRPILKEILTKKNLELYLIVTGTHLSKKYGMTINEIKKDGFKISKRIEFLPRGNTAFEMTKSIGTGITNFAKTFEKIKPDLNVILGDRPEVFASAVAAYNLNIPNAHIHGGDVSGNIDEYTRHAITKISNIHFPATEKSKKRIILMGENPKFVFSVGSPSIDELKSGKITSNEDFERNYGLKLNKKFLILLYHPVTTQIMDTRKNIKLILNTIVSFQLPTIIILPNSDPGSNVIVNEIKKFNKKYNFVKSFSSMPRSDFLCMIKNSGILVGNSSSGIIESSFFGTPVVNIGIRQNGREHTSNVLHVKNHSKNLIKKAIIKALKNKKKKDFLYGRGDSSRRIVQYLETIKLNSNLMEKKMMY